MLVHSRTGDFLQEQGADAIASAAALIRAANSFTQEPTRFELLDGGATQHLCGIHPAHTHGDCGISFAAVLETALANSFPDAAIVHIRGTSADADFVRMALAPMLIVGGGSYAMFAALASRGQVRMPRCVLRFAEDGPCAPRNGMPSLVTDHGLQMYDHPRCRCPDEQQSRHQRQLSLPHTAKGYVLKTSRSEKSLGSNVASSYGLPAFDGAELRRALRIARGIYARNVVSVNASPTQPSHAPSASIAARAVLLTSCNAAYIALYTNWACHVRALGLRHLVWTQDWIATVRIRRQLDFFARKPTSDAVTHRMRSRQPAATLYYSADMSAALGSGPWGASFRSSSFNRITLFKLVAVRHVLRAGFDAWFCDVDVVFRADPWPIFARARQQKAVRPGKVITCDYEYMANEHCSDVMEADAADAVREGNTGFHLLIAGVRALRLIRQILELAVHQPHLDDQALFWSVLLRRYQNGTASFARVILPHVDDRWSGTTTSNFISSRERPSTRHDYFAYCLLPRQTHVNGQCFGDTSLPVVEVDEAALVAHANWLSGHARKASKLARGGLWQLGSDRCPAMAGDESWAAWIRSFVSPHQRVLVK